MVCMINGNTPLCYPPPPHPPLVVCTRAAAPGRSALTGHCWRGKVGGVGGGGETTRRCAWW